jgi:predicted transcriptional regulator
MRREQSHEVTIAAALLNNWQIGEVQKALLEADAGDFATEYQVKKTLAHWRDLGRKNAHQPSR